MYTGFLLAQVSPPRLKGLTNSGMNSLLIGIRCGCFLSINLVQLFARATRFRQFLFDGLCVYACDCAAVRPQRQAPPPDFDCTPAELHRTLLSANIRLRLSHSLFSRLRLIKQTFTLSGSHLSGMAIHKKYRTYENG